MECVIAKNVYGHCKAVYCDVCGEQSLNEMVYHCPKGKDLVHHKNGHDVCVGCALKKVLEDKEKEKEEEPEEAKPEEEAAPQPDDFEYPSQLVQIKQIMAYGDDKDDFIKRLLLEHKGDIAKVVPLLLQ
eukprot:TRINITY_DN584_c0_g1_i1.p1 TRINITY_DN584_c0_g1~~TRINITY_DN584_c0_g1_i1.p1  ORF type:complete len:129 (-),score=52.47 TRINITY_DN584_c0_g1_i1:163-549(-)